MVHKMKAIVPSSREEIGRCCAARPMHYQVIWIMVKNRAKPSALFLSRMAASVIFGSFLGEPFDLYSIDWYFSE